VPLKNINIASSNVNITMDEFFTGTPEQPCIINTTLPYTVTFTDCAEKIAKFVNVNNCTVTCSSPTPRKQQLIILTNQRFNTNKSTNSGIRYRNIYPNGFPKNMDFMFYSKQTGLCGGFVQDPNFIKQ